MKQQACIICALILFSQLVFVFHSVYATTTPSQLRIADRYWYQFKNGTTTKAITVIFDGNMNNDTVWLNDFFNNSEYSTAKQKFIDGLCAAGYDVFVPNCTDGQWSYSGNQTFVYDIMTWQRANGYSFLCLFGFSAGGVIVGSEIQKDYATGFSSAVISSAPVNWTGHGQIFQSAQTAFRDKVAACFLEGRKDAFYSQMLLYYQDACTTYTQWNNWVGGHVIFGYNCSDHPGEDVKTAVIKWNSLVPEQLRVGNYYWYGFKSSANTGSAAIVMFGGTCTRTYTILSANYSIYMQNKKFIDGLRAVGYDVFAPNFTSTQWIYSGKETFVYDTVICLQASGYNSILLFGFSAGGIIVANEIHKDYATRLSTAVLASAPVNLDRFPGIYQSAHAASKDKVATSFLEGLNDPYRDEMLMYYNNALIDKQWLNWSDGHVIFGYNCSDNPQEDVTTAVIKWSSTAHPPSTPFTPTGNTAVLVNNVYYYVSGTFDPNGDNVSYAFNWGDHTYTNVDQCASGQNTTASHTWATPGIYNITVQAQDSTGLWSAWSPPLSIVVS